jgi:hypothetical protein
MPRTDGATAATFRLHPGTLCEKDTLAERGGFEPPVPPEMVLRLTREF